MSADSKRIRVYVRPRTWSSRKGYEGTLSIDGRPVFGVAPFNSAKEAKAAVEEKLVAYIRVGMRTQALAKAVLEWARTPGNHGGNPYTKEFVRLAQEISR